MKKFSIWVSKELTADDGWCTGASISSLDTTQWSKRIAHLPDGGKETHAFTSDINAAHRYYDHLITHNYRGKFEVKEYNEV